MNPRVRRAMGARASLTPMEIATWIVALFVVTITMSTNETLAQNQFFFVAHDASPRTLVVLWLAVLALLLAALVGVLAVLQRFASARAFDAAATLLTFVAAVFLIGNVVAWGVGVVAGAAFAWLARRVSLGKALLVIATVLAMIPLAGVSTQADSPYKNRRITYDQTGQLPDVLWILPDSLQYQLIFDEAGKVRPQYPSLRQLQSNATTFTHAYSTANGTSVSVPSMLNGEDEIPLDSAARQDLTASPGVTAWLSEMYDVTVESPIFPDLCSSPSCAGVGVARAVTLQNIATLAADVAAVSGNQLHPDLATAFPPLDGRWRDFWAPVENSELAATDAPSSQDQDSIAAAFTSARSRPQLGLWHFVGTHEPFTDDFEGRTVFGWDPKVLGGMGTLGANINGSFPTEQAERVNRRMYAATARNLDLRVGQLLSEMKAAGRYDQAMIILTSDHGRAFTRDGHVRLGDDPAMRWNEVAHVPLIVKDPGQVQPRVVEEPRSTAQIAASVLEATGVSVDSGPAIAPALSEEPDKAPTFMSEVGKEADPSVESLPANLPESATWLSSDLEPADDRYPLAVVEPDLRTGQAPPGSWSKFRPRTVDPRSGDSRFQLLVIEAEDSPCTRPGTRAVTTIDGLIVGQILWDRSDMAPSDHVRGWVVVPRAEASEYEFSCQSS